MQKNFDLPKNWVMISTGDLLDVHYGKGLTKQERDSSGIYPVYGSSGIVGTHSEYLIDQPSLIIGRKGSIDSIYYSEKPCFPIDTVYYIELPSNIYNKYLYYYYESIDISDLDSSTTIPSLRREDLESILIPLSPYNEQKRIVNKIEELLSRNEAGQKTLKKSLKLIENYRQSLIKQVVENKYDKIRIGEITSPSKERFHPTKEPNTDYIGLGDIEKNTGRILNVGESKSTKSLKSVFNEGDLLYGRLRPYLNKVVVPDFDGVCSTDIIVFPKTNKFDSKYLQQILLSNDFVSYATKLMSGVQHPRIKFDEIAEYEIPYPPVDVQKRVAEKIDRAFTIIDKIKHTISKSKSQSNNLEKSILKRAFEGRLVPQDSGDEPASVLLERIRAEKQGEKQVRLS